MTNEMRTDYTLITIFTLGLLGLVVLGTMAYSLL
jgi:hypothetical protein